jgi:hypothetical protein
MRILSSTAAHCLPELPPVHPASCTSERTYRIVGPLGGEPSVFAECLFVNPVADLAVLGPPDGHNVDVEWDEFIEQHRSLGVSFWRNELPTRAWLLSLDGEWNPCLVRHSVNGGGLWITEAKDGIRGGMSGSPILADEGKVLGLVSVSRGSTEFHTEGGPNPSLRNNLPLWLVEQL